MKKFLLSSVFSLVLLAALIGGSAIAIPSSAHAASASYQTLQAASIIKHAAVPYTPKCTPTAGISVPYPWLWIEYNGGGDNCTRSDVVDAYADLYHYDGSHWVWVQEAQANCTSCYGVRAYGQYYGAQDGGHYKVEGTYVASDSIGVSSNHTWTRCWVFHRGSPFTPC